MSVTDTEFNDVFSRMSRQHCKTVLQVATVECMCLQLIQNHCELHRLPFDEIWSVLRECIEARLEISNIGVEDYARATQSVSEAVGTLTMLERA